MRVAWVGACLLMTVLCRADRVALLVAIDSYPVVKGRQLSGSAYDLRLMGKMLGFYGFQVDQLARSDATRQAMISKLALLARNAKAGDEVVFYFSGRGSIAPPADKPAAKVQMEPTLVPYDGKETVSDFDLRMKRIEDWAQEIVAKGAHPTIILDASFQSATRDDVGRPYNPTPRTLRRKATMDGEPRDEPFLGPGVYLGATPSDGSAYEYLVNASRNTWAGAFTDMLVNEIVSRLRKGAPASYADALREVQAYFKDKVRQDYMPGLAPYPSSKLLLARADVYDKPAFGGTPASMPTQQKADVQTMDDDRKSRERKLRVGLSFPAVRGRSSGAVPRDADDMERDRDPKLVESMSQYAAQNLPYVEIEPPGAPIDLIVSLVKQPSGGIEARVAGDEVDQARNLRFAGADLPAIMEAGLRAHLERQALTLRLFRLIDDEPSTWQAAPVLAADKESYRPSEPFTLTLTSPGPAWLYIFDRDDSDGIVQMTFPAEGAKDNRLDHGSRSLQGQIEDGSPAGKMLVRALFVESVEGVSIPEIGSDALAGLLAQLRVIVPAIESKRIRYAMREVTLTISP